MFIIDTTKNEATAIGRQTFAGLGFRERDHLQEWIAKNPTMLGEDEELLIIQKEFAGFGETRERLDLLALDKKGNIVVIENKRDDTGADVTWQALKYVSYCSTLTKDDIVSIFQQYLGNKKDAETELREFFEQDDFSILLEQGDQRIIFVAANFRKEVTSTVMWLFNRGIKIKCIKITPYKHGENIFIDTEQIIPVKDAEEYLIRLAQKKQRESITTEANRLNSEGYFNFWSELLPKMNEQSSLFRNVKPKRSEYISRQAGCRGIWYVFSNYGTTARVALWITKRLKQVFVNLQHKQDEIDSKFGKKLEWRRFGNGCSIEFTEPNLSVTNEEDWNKMIEFFVANMIKLEAAINDVLVEVLQDEPESTISE